MSAAVCLICCYLLCFRSFTNQVHELVEFWCDDDLGTTIALLANFGVIALERIILATSTGSEALGINAILGLQSLNNARCA